VLTAGGGTVAVSPDSVSPGTLTVTVPATATSGPVFVESSSGPSGALVVEVTASSSELVRSPVTVAAGMTTGGITIYVPPPAGTLNITDIGAGDRNQSITSMNSSVRLGRGETTDLLIVGAGVSAGAGTTISATGGGLTFSNMAFQPGLVFVRVEVANDAAPGPRSVIATNQNLDTSVLSGGITIE
jgi:hypothetical protein